MNKHILIFGIILLLELLLFFTLEFMICGLLILPMAYRIVTILFLSPATWELSKDISNYRIKEKEM